MDLNSIPLMSALKQRMSYLSKNQALISQNVANADTPGYHAQEAEKQDFSSLIQSLEGKSRRASGVKPFVMKATHPAHLGAQQGQQELSTRDVAEYEENKDGNAVVLENEMIKLADNQMQYGLAVNLYKKNLGLMKIAIGKGGQA
ncbi:flagellar basal body rod protein FlgB [Kordiimonas sediminis]|uniref:Flagellar basal body rod protein FlgB n=1 Tax=Kordiimonas sediminis TaxID=1735581 RepID=A0A919AWR3_9PROT|nr:flagellar basal body rod protein FlgB [Kordiimonas sediminis]GHF27054.1 flagellar basal body rod protein FlgB [Kordiimonas sediminis]